MNGPMPYPPAWLLGQPVTDEETLADADQWWDQHERNIA